MDVKIVNNNGIPEIVSDKISSTNIKIDGINHKVYYYNETIDNSSVLGTETSIRVPGLNSGYLFYSNGGGYGCFVYSTWWEGDNGGMLITGACGLGDCVGFPSQCGYYA